MAVAALALLLCGPETALAQGSTRTVLALFSNRTTTPGAMESEQAFRRTLEADLGLALDLHVEYLDTTDRSPAAVEQLLVDLLRVKHAGRAFELVVANRVESLDFALRHRDALFPGVPIVFADIPRDALAGRTLPSDVTGVVLSPIERQRTVSAALDLQPSARRLVIMSGATEFDRSRAEGARELVRARLPDLDVVMLGGRPLDDQLQALSTLPPDSVVIFTSYRADHLGRSMVAASVLRRVLEVSGAPVYGAVHQWLGMGIVGGDLIRWDTIGEQAARVAARVLRGEAPASIPPVEMPSSELMFDARQLQRWGLDEARLPAGSAVLFRTPSLFEAYRWQVLGFTAFALAQTLLIGGLLFERRTRRRAEANALAEVRERELGQQQLRKALDEIQQLRDQLEVDNTYLAEELKLTSGIEGIVGQSDALGYVLAKARQVADTSSTVLLLGETGVGKDIVATAIHNLSARRNRPLVRVNCAALPPTLIESELFGHEKGAFTGAAGMRKGRFEIADGTTLFLDEVGELPMDLQAKLLRVLQDGEFERVGGNVTLRTNARIIAATNRNLLEEVKAGRFREDLWYRLNVFPITLPPLRQRREDIPLLVRHFLDKHCRRMGRPVLDITKATLKNLESREWVGNVRELESVIERAIITSRGTALQLVDEAVTVSTAASPLSEHGATSLADAERHHIVAMLERTGWQLAGPGGAAELLEINPSTLRSRMQKLGIRRPPRAPAVAVSRAASA